MEATIFARNKITKYLEENFLRLLKRAIDILQNTRRKPFVVKPASNKIAEIDSRLVLLLIKNFDQEIFIQNFSFRRSKTRSIFGETAGHALI